MIRVLAFIFMTLCVLPQCAHALSCMPPVLDQKTIEGAALIFEGTVLHQVSKNTPANVSTPGPQTSMNHNMDQSATYAFSIEMLWKGPSHIKTVNIVRNTYWGDLFRKGEQFLIVAHKNKEGEFEAGLCGNTMHLSAAGDKLEILKLTMGEKRDVKPEIHK